MGMKAICDGCGKEAPAACYNGKWFKPSAWYERTPLDKDGHQQRTMTACSRACIEKIADAEKAAGGEGMRVVLPI